MLLLIVLHALTLPFRRPPPRGGRPLRFVEAGLYLLLVLSVAGLAATAYLGVEPFREGGRMRGWLLWLHLAVAGPFTVLAPLVALVLAEAHRFGPAPRRGEGPLRRYSPATALSFWLLMAGTAVCLGSILLAMQDWYGTEMQELLLSTHRYSSLAVVGGLALHFHLAIFLRRRRAV